MRVGSLRFQKSATYDTAMMQSSHSRPQRGVVGCRQRTPTVRSGKDVDGDEQWVPIPFR